MSLTPEQFNKIATKNDLKELESRLISKEEFSGRFDSMLSAVDGLAKKFDNFHAEMAANQAAHDRLEESITDIKKRLNILERKTA